MAIEIGTGLRVQVSFGPSGVLWVELEAKEYPDGDTWSLLDAREVKLTEVLEATEWLTSSDPTVISDEEKFEGYKAIADAALQLAYDARTKTRESERAMEASNGSTA